MPSNTSRSVTHSRTVSKSLKLSEGQNERLQAVCERLDVSVNSFLVHAVARAIVEAEGKISAADISDNLVREVVAMFQPVAQHIIDMEPPSND